MDHEPSNETIETDQGRDKSMDGKSQADECQKSCMGGKVKRKVRSTRRKLNAMINNASLHFSDTDSEGELSSINAQVSPSLNQAISITLDNVESKCCNLLSPDEKSSLQPSSLVESLTDVDEIYASEPETEIREGEKCLKVAQSPCQAETDLEDFDGEEEEIQSMILVQSRSDIFCDYSGGTITTKEGDGPFSVEVRNKMYLEEPTSQVAAASAPDIVIMPNTDEEDMDMSDEEEPGEACCSQRDLLEDLDVLAASQVVMKNLNKMENTLAVTKDASDDAISDCHTDVEEVDPIE